jgi:hypothetical protein
LEPPHPRRSDGRRRARPPPRAESERVPKLSTVEREREWLAKQFSKVQEAYWEKDAVSLMEPDSFTSVERAFFTGEPT